MHNRNITESEEGTGMKGDLHKGGPTRTYEWSGKASSLEQKGSNNM